MKMRIFIYWTLCAFIIVADPMGEYFGDYNILIKMYQIMLESINILVIYTVRQISFETGRGKHWIKISEYFSISLFKIFSSLADPVERTVREYSNHLRNVSTVRVDYWLEWDATTFISLLPIANPDLSLSSKKRLCHRKTLALLKQSSPYTCCII